MSAKKNQDLIITTVKNLCKIVEKITNYAIDYNCEEILNQNLLGPHFGFKARHLLYLLLEVEKEFDIKIPETDICLGNFDTINNICKIILREKYKIKSA